MKKILPLIFIITASAALSFAQVNKDKAITIKADANACEQNSHYFDMTAIEASKTNERIFAIFRAGQGETENVNARRLAYLKAHIEGYSGWRKLDVVYARGEKTDGEGRIEFYIGGKLFLVTLAQKNKTPCLDCCFGGYTDPQNLVKKKRKAKTYKK